MWSSYNHSYISTKYHRTLKEQCVSLLLEQHLISLAERVPGIWYFGWNSESIFNRNDTVWTMLLEALLIALEYLMKSMEHPSSNICLSLQSTQHPSHFLCPDGGRYQQSGILHEIWELFSNKNDTVWTIRGLQMLSEAPLLVFVHIEKVMKHSNSNGCLSLQQSIPF